MSPRVINDCGQQGRSKFSIIYDRIIGTGNFVLRLWDMFGDKAVELVTELLNQ